MTTIIDAASVAVDTFADLQSVLQSSNDYTTVYLAADITMTAGIAILPSKSQVVIDGRWPNDDSGSVHTLTEYASASTGGTLGIRSASSISMTVRNMNIVGKNYYGILYVPEGSAYHGVTVTYQNVTYSGPQITYHPSGTTRYIDCDITIVGGGYSSINEVGEVYRVEMGGRVNIHHNSTAYPVFWFRGSTSGPSWTVLEQAQVQITAQYDVMMTSSYPVDLAIEPGASLSIDCERGVCRNASYRFSSVLVDTGATLYVDQESSSGYATIYCDGALTVNEGATLYMFSRHASSPPLLYFYSTGASMNLNNPRLFALYSYGQVVLYFLKATGFTLNTYQMNIWTTASAYETAGDFDDFPAFSWRKSGYTPAVVTGQASTSGTTLTGNNFTQEELAVLPPITSLQPGIARVFSCGNLPLTLEALTNDGYPVSGVTAAQADLQVTYTHGTAHTAEGAADGAGAFSVETGAIPAGTQVTVTANIPFLLTSATGVVTGETGALTLESAPDFLSFVVAPIAYQPAVLLGREETGWSLVVSDSRIRGGKWYLYAAVDGPMTGQAPGHILPDSLVLVEDQATLHVLGETPILIMSGESPGGISTTTDISWQATRGILMRTVDTPFYSGERYTAAITWTLTDTPLEGQ